MPVYALGDRVPVIDPSAFVHPDAVVIGDVHIDSEATVWPGADLSGEELTVRVVPKQLDEFTCMSCFLVRHRSQLANEKKMICKECAG